MFESLFEAVPDLGPMERTPSEQAEVDREARLLVLYHQESCWYCARVRRVIEQLELTIQERDIAASAAHRRALLDGGGSIKVPCLRIEEGNGGSRWMYESAAIIEYLIGRFGKTG